VLTNDKGYFIITLKSVKPIDEKKFEKEKKEFGENILNEKKNQAFMKFFTELKKKAQ
jgi:tRNA A22 N-methylase